MRTLPTIRCWCDMLQDCLLCSLVAWGKVLCVLGLKFAIKQEWDKYKALYERCEWAVVALVFAR